MPKYLVGNDKEKACKTCGLVQKCHRFPPRRLKPVKTFQAHCHDCMYIRRQELLAVNPDYPRQQYQKRKAIIRPQQQAYYRRIRADNKCVRCCKKLHFKSYHCLRCYVQQWAPAYLRRNCKPQWGKFDKKTQKQIMANYAAFRSIDNICDVAFRPEAKMFPNVGLRHIKKPLRHPELMFAPENITWQITGKAKEKVLKAVPGATEGLCTRCRKPGLIKGRTVHLDCYVYRKIQNLWYHFAKYYLPKLNEADKLSVETDYLYLLSKEGRNKLTSSLAATTYPDAKLVRVIRMDQAPLLAFKLSNIAWITLKADQRTQEQITEGTLVTLGSRK